MSVSIRDVYCDNCKGHSPVKIFSSMVGKVFTCQRCYYEWLEDVPEWYANREENLDLLRNMGK